MAALELKDPSPLRDRCFIAGEWLDVDQGRPIDVRYGINKGTISTEDDYIEIKNMCMGIS